MDFQDKALTCVECKAEFVFTAGEQQFFADKGFTHEPRRCKTCKTKRKQQLVSAHQPRLDIRVTCAQCGRDTTVPFKPSQGRPVYCRDCFQRRRTMGAGAAV